VAGYSFSPNYTRAQNVALKLSEEHPEKFEVWIYSTNRSKFFEWLAIWKSELPEDSPFQKHKTCPIVWFETEPTKISQVLGGRDRLCEYTIANFPGTQAAKLADKMLNPFESNEVMSTRNDGPLLPKRDAISEGKIRICIVGFGGPYAVRSFNVATKLSHEFPDKYEFWSYGFSRSKFYDWLEIFRKEFPSDNLIQVHKTSPINWFEYSDGKVEIVGGNDRFCDWAIKTHPDSKAAKTAGKSINPFESKEDSLDSSKSQSNLSASKKTSSK